MWLRVSLCLTVWFCLFFFFPLGLCIRPEKMTLTWGSHGPTTNVYIAKMTDCPCLSTTLLQSHQMPWPTIEARRSAPPSHMYTQRTTPSPHTLYRHVSDIQQVCTDTLVALTDLQEDTFLLSLSTKLLDSSHTNQNTGILFAFFFLSFVPEL